MKKNILLTVIVLSRFLSWLPLYAMEKKQDNLPLNQSSLRVKKLSNTDWESEWNEGNSEDEKKVPIELRVSVFDGIVDKLVKELQSPSELRLLLDDYKRFKKKYKEISCMIKKVALYQLVIQSGMRNEVYGRIPLASGSWETSRCPTSWNRLLSLKKKDSLQEFGINWEIRKKRVCVCDFQKKLLDLWWRRPKVPTWLGGNKELCVSSWHKEVSFTQNGDIVQWFVAKTKNELPTQDEFAYITPFKVVKEVIDFFENLNSSQVIIMLNFDNKELLNSEWYKNYVKKIPNSVRRCLVDYYTEKKRKI